MDDILRRVADGDGAAAYDLLQQFFRGRDMSDLLWLLDQGGAGARQAAWLATELPASEETIRPRLSSMLHHTDPVVRGWAVECALLWSRATDPELASRAMELVHDESDSVRHFALQFLLLASDEQIRAGLSVDHSELSRRGFDLLASALREPDEDLVLGRIHDDWPDIAFAAGAAARLYPQFPKPLMALEEHTDETVRRSVALYRKSRDRQLARRGRSKGT